MNEDAIAWLNRHWDQNQYFVPPTFYDPETAVKMRSDTSDPSEDPTGRGEITPEQWRRIEMEQLGYTSDAAREDGCLAGASRHPPSGGRPDGFGMSGGQAVAGLMPAAFSYSSW